MYIEFQSTLPAWGETILRNVLHVPYKISIHSPRMGRDELRNRYNVCGEDFNPLSPHGERRKYWCSVYNCKSFQSTLPAWGETKYILIFIHLPINFNPLSPHGERLIFFHCSFRIPTFQSTLPAWGETLLCAGMPPRTAISIHSPRMGRDDTLPLLLICDFCISIHSPRMGRDQTSRASRLP